MVYDATKTHAPLDGALPRGTFGMHAHQAPTDSCGVFTIDLWIRGPLLDFTQVFTYHRLGR